MTGEASAGDFQVHGFLKKKKKRKHKEYDKKHENYERESVQNAELSCASPLMFEDQAAQNGKSCKKKKKKNYEGKKKESLLNNWCVRLQHETGDETGVDAFRKKKKRKCSDGTNSQNDVICVSVNQEDSDGCQADYIFLKQSVKKKRKEKLPEEDEVLEPPASETDNKNDHKRLKKKKKKKKRHSCTQEMQEDTDVTVDQSLLSSPERSSKGEDAALLLPPEEDRVATPQPWHKDDHCDTSPRSKDSADVPANFSEPTKTPGRPRKTPVHARKEKKSRAFIEEESYSESEEIRTPEPSASNRKKDLNSSFTQMAASDKLNLDNEECLDYSVVGSVMDLETAKQELEEFIPHVRTMSENSVKKMAGRDLMRFKQFKKQGIGVKFGKFSQNENNQIRKNIEGFLSITGIDRAEKLLFTWRYPEEKERINRLKAEHHFCEKLSENIPRPWRLIYYRARKMFDSLNYKGKYTKEEKEKLKKYHALHGNDWKKISGMMSRSNLSVAMKYSEIKSPINYGPWSKEETQKLMHAVEEVFRKRLEMEDANSLPSPDKSHGDLLIDPEKLSQKLPWTEIEAEVGTRYWRQCKQKWNTILTNKLTKGHQLYVRAKGLQTKINLIKRLYEMKVEDANEVNWEELSSIIGDVPKTYIQSKFYKLKVNSVPFWQKKTFSEIIAYLYEEKLPELEERLGKKKKKQLSSDNSTASQQKAFLRLSDIFDTSDDSD